MSSENDELICGRNAVSEALSGERELNSLYVRKGEKNGSLGRIVSAAKEKKIVIKEVDSKKLDLMTGGANHQGVAAYISAAKYATVDEILSLANERNEEPFVIICDGIEDPHNLGAIIRSAEAAGAHGVIIPKRRGVSLTWAVAKASAGAVEHMKVARVTNIASTIDLLKERGIWIYAADMGGASRSETDFSGAVGLVVGSEGRGVSRLIREKSDFIVSLPMKGKVNSLNASVAAGILMYEVVRARENKR